MRPVLGVHEPQRCCWLVTHETAGRLGHLVKSRRQVGRCEMAGPEGERVVAPRCGRPRLAGEDLLDHVADERLLVGLRHALRDQDDDGVAFPVGGHRAGTTAAAPHLDPGAGVTARQLRSLLLIGRRGLHLLASSRLSPAWHCGLTFTAVLACGTGQLTCRWLRHRDALTFADGRLVPNRAERLQLRERRLARRTRAYRASSLNQRLRLGHI